MKNTGITIITGQSGSGKTALLNRFIENAGDEKIHLFIEEDEAIPIDSFTIKGECTVTPFSLGSDEYDNHRVELSTLLDLALDAIRPTQFIVELKEVSSLKRLFLELVRAEVVNVRLVTVLDAVTFTPELLESEWLSLLQDHTDLLWCEGASTEQIKVLTEAFGDRLFASDENFVWFPTLKGWQRPTELLSAFPDLKVESSVREVEFSAWGWFNLQELSLLLDQRVGQIERMKGVVFCKDCSETASPACYSLFAGNGTFQIELCDFNDQLKKIMEEDDFLDILEGESAEGPIDRDDLILRSSLIVHIDKNNPIEHEMELARALEGIWHFQVPWEESYTEEQLEAFLSKELDEVEFPDALAMCHAGLKASTPEARDPFHEKLGIIQRESEDLYNALTHSRFAAALHETAPRLEEMARSCNTLDNYPYAIMLLEKARALDPANHSVLLNTMRLHLVYGNAALGVELIESAFSMAPKDWETILIASHLYFETDRYAELLALYNQHQPLCDASEDFLLTLASAHLDHGAPAKATAILKRLFKADPENVGLLYLLGYADLIGGDMESAMTYFRAALDGGNDISWVYLALGLSLEYQGDKGEAHVMFEEALSVADMEFESDPAYQPFVESAILTRIAMCQVDEAQEIIENNGRDMKFSHEFKNFVKLLSCFKLPPSLEDDRSFPTSSWNVINP